jgi:hypothetical protein
MKTFRKFRADALTEGRKHGNYDSADNEHCSRCGKETNYLMGRNECMRCYQSYAHDTPPEGPKKPKKLKEETCPICRTPGQVKQSGPFRECGNCKQQWNPALQPSKKALNGKRKPKKVSEDEGGSTGGPLPTNSAGSANIAGIGIVRQGDPTFAEPGVPVRRKLEIVGPDPVDPRVFSDKIFGHSKLADTIHKTGVK